MKKDKIEIVHYDPGLSGDWKPKYEMKPYCNPNRHFFNLICDPNINEVNCKRCIRKLTREGKL